jgi:tyrosyl-tRNA synthetase
MVPRAQLEKGVPVFELLVLAGLVSSKSEGRKLVQGGGARVNDEAVSDEKRPVGLSDLKDGAVKLSAGKKRHVLVKPA